MREEQETRQSAEDPDIEIHLNPGEPSRCIRRWAVRLLMGAVCAAILIAAAVWFWNWLNAYIESAFRYGC